MDANCNGNCEQGRQCDCVPDFEFGLPEGAGVVIWPIFGALVIAVIVTFFTMVVL